MAKKFIIDKSAIVYQATNLIDGKRYIGVTTQPLKRRISNHKYSANKRPYGQISIAIKEYGIENFKFEILDCANTWKEGWEAEKRIIKELNPEYNMIEGGYSEKGVTCLNDGKFFKMVKDAAEFYEIHHVHISKVCNGKELSAGGLYFRHSIKPLTKDECLKEITISNKRKKTWHNGEWKSRKVKCLNDNCIFNSLSAAAKEYEISLSTVFTICKGRRKQTKTGLKFKYIE